jgi:uncharacterized protein
VPADLHDRLSRLSALKPVRRTEPLPAECANDQTDRLAAMVGATLGRNRYGEHLLVRQWYARPQMCEPHADVLPLLLPAGPQSSTRAAAHAADPARWLFLDTETTGLAGGTGTYAFLVGLAWWDSGGLAVEQFFMRDLSEEHSLLLEIARRLRERPVLVTFNGKCFDWPLLETRFRMTRAIEPPALSAHLDLLHPARQLWRLQLGSVRLAELERSVLGGESLGWSRQEDIVSSCIPGFYFDYLRGGPAAPLTGVFRHNRMDLRGLAALAGHIFRTLAAPDTAGSTERGALELFGISRILHRRGSRARARATCEHALRAGLPPPADRTARRELARMARRDRDYDRAAELWHDLARDSVASFEACEQLAIHYERRMHDFEEAARQARSSLRHLRRALRIGSIEAGRHGRLQARLERRLARLDCKLARKTASPREIASAERPAKSK